MISRRATIVVAALLAAGCGGESHQDLRDWMRDQGKGALGKLDPLPQIRPYEPFAYNAFDLPDPFKPRKIEPAKGGGSKLAPDLARSREPLESFWREKGKAFESDLVAPPIDVILAPGEPKVVPVPLYAETVFIGVAADFRKPNLQDWRQIISVPGRGIRELAILVGRDGLKIETVR